MAIPTKQSSQASSSVVFPLLLSLSLILSAATAYLQLAVVTLANAYGPSCMGTMLAGQGVVGASVSVVQLITAFTASARSKLSAHSFDEENDPRKAAYRFFGANTVFMIIGLVTFLILQRTMVYSDMRMKMDNAKIALIDVLAQEATRQGEFGGNSSSRSVASVSGIKRYMSYQAQQQLSRVASTQKKVVLASFSIAYIFTVTLAIFPALTARVQSTTNSLPNIIFVALHFFAFNMGDFLGRTMPSIFPRLFLKQSIRIVAALCLLRTAFLPLLSYCNVTTSSSPSLSTQVTSFTPLFGDTIFFLLMALLGFSNGSLATSLFILGPRQDNLTEPNDQSLAVGLLTWWLTFGLAIGSLSSFIVAARV